MKPRNKVQFNDIPRNPKKHSVLFLPISDVASFSCVSKESKSIADDPLVWQQKLSELTSFTDFPQDENRKNRCKTIYEYSTYSQKHIFTNEVIQHANPIFILSTPRAWQKLDDDLLNDLVIRQRNEPYYLAAIDMVLKNEKMANCVHPYSFNRMFFRNADIGLKVLGMPSLVKKLCNVNLFNCVAEHTKTAEFVLGNQSLFPQCVASDFEELQAKIDKEKNNKLSAP